MSHELSRLQQFEVDCYKMKLTLAYVTYALFHMCRSVGGRKLTELLNSHDSCWPENFIRIRYWSVERSYVIGYFRINACILYYI